MQAGSADRRCFPEIAVISTRLVALLDAEPHAQAGPHAECRRFDVDEFHEEACADIELGEADIHRWRWVKREGVGRVRQDTRPFFSKAKGLKGANRCLTADAVGKLRKLHLSAGGAFACDKTVDL